MIDNLCCLLVQKIELFDLIRLACFKFYLFLSSIGINIHFFHIPTTFIFTTRIAHLFVLVTTHLTEIALLFQHFNFLSTNHSIH